MNIKSYEFPKSSFLSIEKDYSLIVNKIISNQRLLKLLFYNSSDALKRKDIEDKDIIKILDENIKLVPQIQIGDEVKSYLVITFDDFSPNATNSEFRNNLLIFDIICHTDLWNLQDFQMRPYKIAGELDSMFEKKKLSGIGRTQFVTCQQLKIDSSHIGFTMVYRIIHGEEDKKDMLNPDEWAAFVEDYNNESNK